MPAHFTKQQLKERSSLLNVFRFDRLESGCIWGFLTIWTGIGLLCFQGSFTLTQAFLAGFTGTSLVLLGAFFTLQGQLTRAKKTIQELNKSKEQIKESAQSKCDFLASMSHEIRTPITAILGYVDVALDEVPEKSNVSKLLQTVDRNGKHLLQLINDILDISKIEAGKLELEILPCSPHQLVSETIELFSAKAKEQNLSIEPDFQEPIPASIKTDPTRLRQILLNLIGNALKFTKNGGVTLKTEFLESEKESFLKISVSDTGIGMSEQQLDALFQPFAQADQSVTRLFGGTGLGLSISKHLALQLGGDISVQSQPGSGSTFCVTVSTEALEWSCSNPDNKEPQKQQKTASAQEEKKKKGITPTTLKNCRLLLVEDGKDNQKLISYFLTKAGANVTLADNGQIGLEKAIAAEHEGNPFEIVLMDMQMPIMDGYSATRELRSHSIETPVIAITAHAMSGDREKCLQTGCNDYLTKPINKEELIDKVFQLTKKKENVHF